MYSTIGVNPVRLAVPKQEFDDSSNDGKKVRILVVLLVDIVYPMVAISWVNHIAEGT
jgi:hypothetical protein